MHLPVSRALVPRITELRSTRSTNSVLLEDRAAPSWAVVVTTDQSAGRGRFDRSWVARPGDALALSVVVRGVLGFPWASWIPLAAGAAMTAALAELGPGAVLKWPNDVLIDARKVCGILVEAVPGTADVVIGSGVNLRQTADGLPVPTATSLVIAGVEVDDATIDDLVSGYLGRLAELLGPTTTAARIREAVIAHCVTLGREVRIEPGDGEPYRARAVDLDDSGRLRVRLADGSQRVVSAADVTHAIAL